MSSFDFEDAFKLLTGNSPFPWQARLFQLFTDLKESGPDRFPPCNLPTGLGKTSVIAIWLLALAKTAEDKNLQGRIPRRLAYVVNRRTIVDQATHEAENQVAFIKISAPVDAFQNIHYT